MSNKNKRNLQKKHNISSHPENIVQISSKNVWSAPLPPPEILNAYSTNVQEAIISGATEYRKHNIETGRKVTETESFTVKTVAATYFVSTTFLLFLGGISILLDKAITGTIITTIGVAIGISPKLIDKKNDNRK